MGPLPRPLFALLLASALTACGANETPAESTEVEDEPSEERAPVEEAPTEVAEPETPPEPEAPPEPDPVVVEAGTRLGPIRIGMTLDEVRALGLEEGQADPRTRTFGPYHVVFGDDGVERVAAQLGELERVQYGDQVFDLDTHIHAMRDAFPDCEWYEGGGERYRCADRTLFVRTLHSMDPRHYELAVARR